MMEGRHAIRSPSRLAHGALGRAHSRGADAAELRGLVDLRGLLSIAPIAVYLGMRQIVASPLAIGAGFAVAAALFAMNRRRGGRVIQWLALLGLLAIAVGAVFGLVLESERAFLANDIVGDYFMALLLVGSIIVRRPLAGAIVHELFPRLRMQLPDTHRVFVQVTWMYVLSNVLMGTYRVVLLLEAGVSEYVLYSRMVSWPLGIAMFAAVWWMLARARRLQDSDKPVLSELRARRRSVASPTTRRGDADALSALPLDRDDRAEAPHRTRLPAVQVPLVPASLQRADRHAVQ